MHTKTRDPFDQFLGPTTARYFGSGFLDVEHGLSAIVIDPALRRIEARAKVTYGRGWSAKNSLEQRAHLSSIDAIVLAIALAEEYLKHGGRFRDEDLSESWVSGVDVRAGGSPTTDLSNFVSVAAVEEVTQCGPGSSITFRAKIGSLVVGVTICTPIRLDYGPEPERVIRLSQPTDPEHRIYGELHKRTRLEVGAIVATQSRCTAQIALMHIDRSNAQGLESGYADSAPLLGMVILVAQMAQVLLYNMDGLSRDDSETLWMRRIKIDVASPIRSSSSPLAMTVHVGKSGVVDMRAGGHWRASDFVLEDLFGISGVASAAHQISGTSRNKAGGEK